MAIADLIDDDEPRRYQSPSIVPDVLNPSRQNVPGAVQTAATRSANGYNPPAATAAQQNWGYLGGGVDINKLNDPTHNTPKYELQRILAQWNPQQLGRPGLLALTPEQRRQIEALGYRIVDEDKVFRQDVGELDVLHGDRMEWGHRLTGVGNTVPVKPGKSSARPNSGTLPNGGSVIRNTGGARLGTLPTTQPGTASGVRGMNPNAQGSSRIFDDPATRLLEDIAKWLIDNRMQPLQNPEIDRYQDDATEQMRQLRAPVYSEPEEAALRVKSFDQLEQDRATAKQQAIERLAAMGHGKESGTYEEAIDLVDRRFDKLRAQRENDFTTGAIDERQRRLSDALRISGQTANVTTSEQNRQEGRQDSALTTSAIFPDLASDRLTQATNVLNGQSGNTGSLLTSVSQVLGQNRTDRGNSALMWEGVIDLINEALRPTTRTR